MHTYRSEAICGCSFSVCCIWIALVAGCHSAKRPQRIDGNSLLPRSAIMRISSADENVVDVVHVTQLGYQQRNYGNLLGFSGTLATREGPALWIHQDFLMIQELGGKDWLNSAIFRMVSFPNLLSPCLWDLMDMSKDEMDAWLTEHTSLTLENFDSKSRISSTVLLSAGDSSLTNTVPKVLGDGKTYEELSKIASTMLTDVGDKYRPHEDSDSWWFVLPRGDAQDVLNYMSNVWEVADIAMEVYLRDTRKIHVFLTNGSTITFSSEPVVDKKPYASFDEVNKYIYTYWKSSISPDRLSGLFRDCLNGEGVHTLTTIVLTEYLDDAKANATSSWIWYPSEFVLRKPVHSNSLNAIYEIYFVKDVNAMKVRKTIIRETLPATEKNEVCSNGA